MHQSINFRWTVICIAFMLSGCGGDSGSFLSELELPTFGGRDDGSEELIMPPGLDAPIRKNTYDVPGSAPSLKAKVMSDHVLPRRPDMRFRREGNAVWLSVDMSPVTLWPHVRNFWIDYGFRIENERPTHGVMETIWREQNLSPDGTVRVLDKFLTRFVRDSNAVTHIYIVNRKNMMTNGKQDIAFSDTETEINVLYDLMAYLAGVKNTENLSALPTLEESQLTLDIQNQQGIPVLTVGHPYSQVWRLMGSALARADFEVIDSDRSRRIYLIRYRAPDTDALVTDNLSGSLIQLHLLPAEGETFITTHLNRAEGDVVEYEVAYDILRRIVMAY